MQIKLFSFCSDCKVQIKIIIDKGLTQVCEKAAGTKIHSIAGAVNCNFTGSDNGIINEGQLRIENNGLSDRPDGEVAVDIVGTSSRFADRTNGE